ncbi:MULTISPECIES: large conductance mechanosensitive channel protein MscL [Gordonia]|uniref:Large-conductance mechanosensitive channel n=1 Tax=Gordonia cholesterolivorans TaxID=559625 RepID=A0ABN3GZX4_9ACTN|nr:MULTISPECIES: large conductance mechanosensitive channel protein MscL [Gordonia]KJR06941.1 mechanosensitive ion channel protein MscL [Gordonia sihwensis]KXT56478.1 mechanosensitive ion channel protein MscL [Gordonia sp. QH-12]
MLKGFKDFIMRGNVVELATAVIIGAAFTAIVTAFTEKIINPLLATIPSGDCPTADGAASGPAQICGFGFSIKSDDPATFLDFGAVISAVINFIIVAAVVYFLIVVPYNKLQELRKLQDKEEDPDPEIVLLTQIRNALDPDAKERDEAEKAAKEAEMAAADRANREPAPTPPAPMAPPPSPGYGDRTQTMNIPPQAQQAPPQAHPQHEQQPGHQGFTPPSGPPTGGFPTPNPAPGEYPPPGNLPPGQYAPGQYPPPPGQNPGDAPRHSR